MTRKLLVSIGVLTMNLIRPMRYRFRARGKLQHASYVYCLVGCCPSDQLFTRIFPYLYVKFSRLQLSAGRQQTNKHLVFWISEIFSCFVGLKEKGSKTLCSSACATAQVLSKWPLKFLNFCASALEALNCVIMLLWSIEGPNTTENMHSKFLSFTVECDLLLWVAIVIIRLWDWTPDSNFILIMLHSTSHYSQSTLYLRKQLSCFATL